jgi:hypothetical protein
MRGRRLEKTGRVASYTCPPQALSHPLTPRLPRQALCPRDALLPEGIR